MTRGPASPLQPASDLDKVESALLSLARLLGEAAAAETRAYQNEHEDPADGPQEDP